MKVLFLFLVVCSITIQPIFAQVETYNIEINCPVDNLDFTGYTVIFDELELCEATGNILYSDIPQQVIIGNDPDCSDGYFYDDEFGCVPIEQEIQEPIVEKKLVKKQIDDIIKQKRAELKELLKQKFGDKWKEKWKSIRSELLGNLNSILEWIKSLKK